MAPLKEEEENNDMNMDSDNDKENKDKMVIDTKIEVENQSPAIPKFNANSNSTPDIASSTNNAYTKFNNKSTQKYVFHSKVNNSTFGQNNFSNVKKTTQIHPLINNKNNLTKNKNLGNMSLFQNRQNKSKCYLNNN